jgi:Coenzyme PQQ synthesis protein D (PqqD)
MGITTTDRKTARPQDRKTKYTRNAKTISGRLHDEMVMMDLEQGKYFSLNPVATRIWELLENPHSADEICGTLMEEYEVEPDHCRSEVIQVLEELLGMGLVLASR